MQEQMRDNSSISLSISINDVANILASARLPVSYSPAERMKLTKRKKKKIASKAGGVSLQLKKSEESTMQWNGTILNLIGEVTDQHCLCFCVFVISAESQLSSSCSYPYGPLKSLSSSIHLSGCIPFFTSSSFISLTGCTLSRGIAHGELLSTIQSSKVFVVSKSNAVNTIYTLSPSECSLYFLATKKVIILHLRRNHFSRPSHF